MKRAKPLKFAELPRRSVVVDGKPVIVVEAVGSCGFGTTSKVEVAHIHGAALFLFDGPAVPSKLAPYYICVAAGIGSCTGPSRDEALTNAVRQARSSTLEMPYVISIDELQRLALTSAPEQEDSYASN